MEIEISIDETHHIINGKPMYEKRYTKVMSFHEPGIAAVLDGNEAYHIGLDGNPLYTKRFEKTFGFYEEKAAVKDESGWFHIDTFGNPIYQERFEWVGNFQEGRCVAKDSKSNYFHIERDGSPAYKTKYRYAGDFKYGIGVVYGNEGYATHIDCDGNPIHNKKFLELDVFHKGFARARDEEGWFHIDKNGNPIYNERYEMIEPFYNGFARVQVKTGHFLVIMEDGTIVAKLSQDSIDSLSDLNIDWLLETNRSSNGAIYPVINNGKPKIIKSNIALNLYHKELKILKSFSSDPNTSNLINNYEISGFGYLIMEKSPGETLGTIRRCKALDKPIIEKIVQQLLNFLDRFHRKGWIHTDLQPTNILVDLSNNNPLVTVIDFEHALKVSNIPETKEIHWGIWEFIPPEQIGPLGVIDIRSDLYSVGALTLSMHTGEPPIRSPRPSPNRIDKEIREILFKRKVQLQKNIPKSCPWKDFLQQVLSPDPESRPKTALDMLKLFENNSK